MIRRALLLVAAALLSPVLRAETVWITDDFTVPLRSGPSDGHRIVHRGLQTGTELEVLGVNTAAEYTHVRAAGGVDGWISTQYLVREPIARVQLAAQLAKLEAELADVKQVSAGALEEHARSQELSSLNARLRAEVDDLTEESQRLENNIEQRWLLIGGALVLGGMIAGVAIKARPRRSGWS